MSWQFSFNRPICSATLAMAFKLALEAKKTWKRLSYRFIPLVPEGKPFIDRELKEDGG